MNINKIITVRDLKFLNDIIKSIGTNNILIFNNLLLNVVSDKGILMQRLNNPALMIKQTVYVFPNDTEFNKTYIKDLLINNYYGEISFKLDEEIDTKKSIEVVFDDLTLADSVKSNINKYRERLLKYYPEGDITLSLGYYLPVNDESLEDDEEYIEIAKIDYCGYAMIKDKIIILDNEVGLRNICRVCQETCFDISISGYICNEKTSFQKRLTNRN